MYGFCCLNLHCSGNKNDSSSSPNNFVVIGQYAAHYDPISGQVEYSLLNSSSQSDPHFQNRALNYNNTTGVTNPFDVNKGGAIRDTSKVPGDLNYEMGLVDPDSCVTDYNSTTKILSFYTKLVNKSNLANDSSPYLYTDTTNFAPNTTFYSPFYFKITGLSWWDVNNPPASYPQLITAINSNLAGAECGANGLSLTSFDSNANNVFDCVWPDQSYTTTDSTDPGWNFSPYITGGNMTPGEDTGCVLFMQFTLTQNSYFTIYFDLLAVKDDGSLPATPTVTSPIDNSYVNTNPYSVTGTCTAGATVYVEGGDSAVSPYPRTTTCTGGGTFSVSVDLNLNSTNILSVYQVVSSEQSGAATVTVIHDNVAPTLVSTTPANNEQNVSGYTNCTFAFSETMKSSTFSSSAGCGGTFVMCNNAETATESGTITLSNNDTQAIYDPSVSQLTASTTYKCKATTGLTDLAGNALSASTTVSFTINSGSGFYEDDNRPHTNWMIPQDNARNVSTSTKLYFHSNEAVDPNTIFNASTKIPLTNCGTVPNVALFKLSTCDGSAQTAATAPGTMSLSANGRIATFTPDSTLSANTCYGYLVRSCIEDLGNESAPPHGTQSSIPGYGASATYHAYYQFKTGSSDSTSPSLVHIGPTSTVTGVTQSIHPFLAFSEPIHPDTIISNYFFLNKFGNPSSIAATLTYDPNLQLITLHPTSVLNTTTTATHVVTATGAVTDLWGNTMVSPQTSQFDVTSSADSTVPSVVQVVPANGSNTDSRCPLITIDFSEPMDTTTLTTNNIQLVRVSDGAVKPAHLTISDDGMNVDLNPLASFATSESYTPTISANVKDRAGNTMGSTYNATTFNVTADSTAPTVTAVVPGAGSTIVQNQSIAVIFSEPMNRYSISDSIMNENNGLSCTPLISMTPDSRIAIVNCPDLIPSGSRNIRIDRNARAKTNNNNDDCDDSGVGTRMGGDYGPVSFTVSASLDTTGPTVNSVSPTDGSTSVSTSISPTITFNEEIDPRTIMPSTLFLMDREGNLVNATLSISTDIKTVTLNPAVNLSTGFYYIVATTAIRDLAGGNAYDGNGGETTSIVNVLRTCFSTSSSTCP